MWAPIQEDVKVIIYENYHDNYGEIYPMKRTDNGVWELKLDGDYGNKYYNYIVKIDEYERETPDPYAKGATVNGTKGMIVDFDSINPEGWENHSVPRPIKPTESILYETHLRDFSIDKSSGIKNKGKYLSFTEHNTNVDGGLRTGIEHLKELGITHVHLMPVFDFASVDEREMKEYNWGYDPYLYNVPEGSYSTNPYDGRVRIREFKKMIMDLHEAGVGVIMDVVYNHTFTTADSPFDILVPKYYYRTDDKGHYTNGSGVGNEIASERPMVRKFIVDSLKFWAREYKIDGFRFDLMALFDIETVKEIERELRSINPNIILYGEPWTGWISNLPENKQFKKGRQQEMDIALFNDGYRDDIKGDNNGNGLGFVTGANNLEHTIKTGVAGSIYYNKNIIGFAKEPGETINYVSAHDNLCLYDKIQISRPDATEEEIVRMNRLALSIILTSQGIPFIQGGTEILRTKYGHYNSYNAGDEINKIDWTRKSKYLETFNYIKGLIELRKSQKIMTLDKAEDIQKYLQFIDSPSNSVTYMLNSPYAEDYRHILIVHNANKKEITINIPIESRWKVITNENEVNIDGIKDIGQTVDKNLKVPPISTWILGCK